MEYILKRYEFGSEREYSRPYEPMGLMQTLKHQLDSNIFVSFGEIIRSCRRDTIAWFPDTADNVFFLSACVAGEAGEVVNEAKKIYRGGGYMDSIQRDKLEEESIDVLIYLANLWAILGTDIRKAYYAKRDANAVRFGGSGPAGES